MRAMINRYDGNSGRVFRYSEAEDTAPRHKPQAMPKPQKPLTAQLDGLSNLGRLIPERIGQLENEDLILLLILYLMYKESGDSDLLIIMGAMFLL